MLNPRKAPGRDLITAQMLKNYRKKFLLTYYTYLMQSSEVAIGQRF